MSFGDTRSGQGPRVIAPSIRLDDLPHWRGLLPLTADVPFCSSFATTTSRSARCLVPRNTRRLTALRCPWPIPTPFAVLSLGTIESRTHLVPPVVDPAAQRASNASPLFDGAASSAAGLISPLCSKNPLLRSLQSPIPIRLHPQLVDLTAVEDCSVEGLEQLLLRQLFQCYEVKNRRPYNIA